MPYIDRHADIGYHKEYYKNNIETIKARARKHYNNNKKRHQENMTINYNKLKADPVKWRAYLDKHIEWTRQNPLKRKHYSLKSKFGITLEDFQNIGENQNWSCLICQIQFEALSSELCVDHNHITGKIRGLLCKNCNKGIGCLKDNLTNLKQAVFYLEERDNENFDLLSP